MKRLFLCFIGVLLITIGEQNAFAQQKKPKWAAEGYFEDGKTTYVQCISAIGYNYDDALKKAQNFVYQDRNVAAGTDVSVTINNDNVQVESQKTVTVKARIIDKYYEYIRDGEHKVYLLVQTAKNPTYEYDPIKLTDRYRFSPRVFIPGMAQIHKGSVGKGMFFITSEVVLVGGVIVFESMRTNNINKISSTHDAKEKEMYADYANSCATARNISIAGAIGVYAWNIIDGIAAKGKQHIILGDATIKISPYTDYQSTGFALNIIF